MRFLRVPFFHLYLLQLEGYEVFRFWKALFRAYLPPKGKLKKELQWTLKLRLVFIIALVFCACFIGAVSYFSSSFSFLVHGALVILTLAICFLLFFLFSSLAVLFLYPADFIVRKVLVYRAKRRLSHFAGVTIVAITGSFGKTTMKEMLKVVLGTRYRVLVTPENVNTPVGVARVILNSLNADTNIFIVEMGAHHEGDIRELCLLTPPDVSILTGINESHLERFGSLEATVRTKFEIVRHAKPGARILLNADNDYVVREYNKHVGKRQLEFYSGNNHALSCYKVSDVIFNGKGGVSCSVGLPSGEMQLFEIPLLPHYAAGLISAALQVGEWFSLPLTEVRLGLSMVRPAVHRLEPHMLPNNILLIDDSYNGNPDGVREAIMVLSRFQSRRKIFVTPGLVEMGESTRLIHKEIGRGLAPVCDLVVLIRTSVTPYIAEGLREAGFPGERLVWLEAGVESFQKLRSYLEPGDVVLLQNDWPENYY